MRFILNFFIFGFLFYLLWMFFPEVFNTLVSWANGAFEFLKEIFNRIRDSIGSKEKEQIHTTLGYLFNLF